MIHYFIENKHVLNSTSVHFQIRYFSSPESTPGNFTKSPLQLCSGHSLAMWCAVWFAAQRSHDAGGASPIWFKTQKMMFEQSSKDF